MCVCVCNIILISIMNPRPQMSYLNDNSIRFDNVFRLFVIKRIYNVDNVL